MNRKILFKAKRIDNGEWVEGHYFCMIHNDGRHDHHFIIPLGTDLSLGTPIEKIQVEVDYKTVCEYTGLLDKNGKKVFEGDIVKHHFEEIFGPIKYGLYQNCFDTKYAEHYGFYVDWKSERNLRKDLGYWVHLVDTEIVGNIFDNPEFLKGETNE